MLNSRLYFHSTKIPLKGEKDPASHEPNDLTRFRTSLRLFIRKKLNRETSHAGLSARQNTLIRTRIFMHLLKRTSLLMSFIFCTRLDPCLSLHSRASFHAHSTDASTLTVGLAFARTFAHTLYALAYALSHALSHAPRGYLFHPRAKYFEGIGIMNPPTRVWLSA